MKKKKALIIVSIFAVLVGYFLCKSFSLLVLYNIDDAKNVMDLEIDGYVDLNYSQKLENDVEYLEFKNIKIRNDFKNFKYREDISTDSDQKYVLYDESGEVKASFWIGLVSSYVGNLRSGFDALYVSNSDFKNVEKYLEDNNIDDDIELFKYIEKNKDKDLSIFTSVKKMRERFVFYYLVNTMLPDDVDITLIDGTYKGYMFELDDNKKNVCIIDGNECYNFTFIGDDYSKDEYIYDLLSTVVIESNNKATFTRTYTVIEKFESNSLEYDSFKIKEFQGEEAIVEVKKSLSVDIELNKNYEFTFKKSSDNLEDNIESIFGKTELISVTKTDKVGLEQIQDEI